MPYSTPPGSRLAYDLDGTVVVVNDYLAGVVRDVKPAGVAAMNHDHMPGVLLSWQNAATQLQRIWDSTVEPRWVAMLFPFPTRIRGLFVSGAWITSSGSRTPYRSKYTAYGSVNTTNGVDGDWVYIAGDLFSADPAVPPAPSPVAHTVEGVPVTSSDYIATYPATDAYRRLFSESGFGIYEVNGATTRNLRGLRLLQTDTGAPSYVSDAGVSNLGVHLYGEGDTGAQIDRLTLWRHDMGVEVPPGWFDWGNVPQGSSAQKVFRVHNESATATAAGVTVDAVPALSNTSPAPDASLLFSQDAGVTWLSTAQITLLSPGATSPPILVRRVTPLDAALSNWAPRITAEVGEWT